MDKPQELRKQLDTLKEEIRSLSETETLDEEQETRFDAALTEYKALEERTVASETRAAAVQSALNGARHWDSGVDEAPNQINRSDPFQGELRSAPVGELRDRSMRVLESRGKRLGARQIDHVDELLRVGGSGGGNEGAGVIAQRLLVTESESYHSAWMKQCAGRNDFTPEEHNALQEFRRVDRMNDIRAEARAANEGTTTAGGFGIPVLIDPTIVLTSGAANAPLLAISRIDTITTNQWKGVSSAGFTWAFQAESAAVTDNSPTLAQPTIPVYAARGFIPYTLEVEQDYPGFESEMARLLAQGYLNLVAKATMTGTGSSQPTGIFTGVQTGAGNSAHIVCTTLGTVGAVDVRKAWAALPEMFRPNATYVMSVPVENQIRAWGNGLALSDYTVNMIADGSSILTGRPVVLSDYAAAYVQGTTTAQSALVVGDFQHFRIIQRAGMSVEPVPHLFDPTTALPIGQRGWFGFARWGSDADTYNAFRLVSNT